MANVDPDDLQRVTIVVRRVLDLAHQARPIDDLPRVSRQVSQNPELGRRQINHVSTKTDLDPVKIDHQIADLDGLLDACPLFATPPEQCLHPSQEYSHAERFGQIVISTKLESPNDIVFVDERRQHQDRSWTELPHPTADFEAINVGKEQVKDDEVGPTLFEGDQSRCSIRGYLDLQPILMESKQYQASNGLIIFHQENARHLENCPPRAVGPIIGPVHLERKGANEVEPKRLDPTSNRRPERAPRRDRRPELFRARSSIRHTGV